MLSVGREGDDGGSQMEVVLQKGGKGGKWFWGGVDQVKPAGGLIYNEGGLLGFWEMGLGNGYLGLGFGLFLFCLDSY